MFDFFPDGPVYEYPQLVNVLYNFAWAFVLSALIAITHKATFSGIAYPKTFFQSLILGAIVTTMVMLAIGDSLARGLGVFGAMAIIRFRTRVDDPRDVLFLFAALSTGLAVGVYGFTISFVGTLLFCGVAFILHATSYRAITARHDLYFSLVDTRRLTDVLAVVEAQCLKAEQVSIQFGKDELIKYVYRIAMEDSEHMTILAERLRILEGVSQIRIVRVQSIN